MSPFANASKDEEGKNVWRRSFEGGSEELFCLDKNIQMLFFPFYFHPPFLYRIFRFLA